MDITHCISLAIKVFCSYKISELQESVLALFFSCTEAISEVESRKLSRGPFLDKMELAAPP
jgi:hypothetical protein